MRPLAPVDAVLPENASGAADAQVATTEAQARAQAAVTALQAAQAALQGALGAVPVGATPTEAQVAAIRTP